MKKSFRFLLVAIFTACLLAMSALAVSVEYRAEAVSGVDNAFDMYVNVKSENPVASFATRIIYNNEILQPADYEYNVADVEADPDAPIAYVETKSGRTNIVYQKAEHSWKVDGNKTTLKMDCFSVESSKFNYADLDILFVSFVFAEGKTKTDLKAGDFVIDMAYVGCLEGDGSKEYAYNFEGVETPLTFTNNVVPSTTAKITVPAGSSVIFQDYTQAAYEAETEVDVDITTDGFVVVNTGYTAQTVYQVANGSIAKVGNFEDGLLGSANTDIRADSKYQGIRFHSFITDIARTEADDNKIVEYGYVVTAESKKNALPANYELNMSMVDAGKAFKGVAFDAKTNIVFKKNDDNTEFTGLVVGIPMTKDGLNTIIAARPYYKTQSGKYVYGKMTRKTVAETAKAIKAEGGETYNNNKDYIDKILSTVAEDFTEISIDVSELYAE